MKCVSNSTQARWARDGPAPTVGPSVGIHGRALGFGGRVGERQNERVLADESHLLTDLLREGPAWLANTCMHTYIHGLSLHLQR